MILLHAVTRALPDGADIDRMRARTAGSVTVLHEHVDGPPVATRAAVVDHGRRIIRLAECRPVLPMRYGTTVDSVPELDALIAEHAENWDRRLTAVDGHCELLVHVDFPTDDDGDAAATGREYLLRRSAQLRQRDQTWHALEEVVRPSCRETRALTDGRRLAVLVPRDDVDRLRSAVATWASAHPDLRVAVTGPWPPFTFCEDPTGP